MTRKKGHKEPPPRKSATRRVVSEAALRAEVMELASNHATVAEIAESVGKSPRVVQRLLETGRQVDAFRLRISGFTYREIADQTQPRRPHPERAKRAVQAEIAHLERATQEDGEFLRRLHWLRLEDLYSKLAPLLNGDKDTYPDRPAAVRAALRILQEQAKMLRLYPQGDDLLERAVAGLIEGLGASVGTNPALAAGLARLRDALFARTMQKGDPAAAKQWALLASQALPEATAAAETFQAGKADTRTVLVLPAEDLSIYQQPAAALPPELAMEPPPGEPQQQPEATPAAPEPAEQLPAAQPTPTPAIFPDDEDD